MPSYLVSLSILICASVYCAVSLTCYEGWQIWDEHNSVNNVSLVPCLARHKCCYFIASLPGNNYGCYDDCPPRGTEACGPDPSLGIQDVRYCYCRDHRDKRCQPYLGNRRKR